MSEVFNQKHVASKMIPKIVDLVDTELKNIQHYFEELK